MHAEFVDTGSTCDKREVGPSLSHCQVSSAEASEKHGEWRREVVADKNVA